MARARSRPYPKPGFLARRSRRNCCGRKAPPRRKGWLRLGTLRFRPADGKTDQLRGGFYFQLAFDVRAVDLDGFDTQMEMLGNLPGPLPLANELEHLKLAVREPFDWRMNGFGAAS